MSQEILARLIESGTPAQLVAAVAMEFAKGQAAIETLNGRREKDRERKRADVQLPRNSSESAEILDIRGNVDAKEIPPDPHKKTSPLKTSLREVTPRQASRLPDDFAMPGDWIDWAMERRGWTRPEAVEEGECFCRYWQAKGRDAAKRSWKKTWQNWVVTARRASPHPAPEANALYASIERKYAGRA